MNVGNYAVKLASLILVLVLASCGYLMHQYAHLTIEHQILSKRFFSLNHKLNNLYEQNVSLEEKINLLAVNSQSTYRTMDESH